MTDREKMIDLIINAKKSNPETGSFTEYLADFLLGYGIKLPDPTPQPGKPLTLEQLREMDGKPVWIERIEAPYDGKWFIVNYADTENPDKTLYTDSGVTYSEYGKYFIAYPSPPTHIDRSKWQGCEVCKGAKYVSGWVSAVAPIDSGHDCETRAEGDFDYCPVCGRPLTDEAWVELERRLRG